MISLPGTNAKPNGVIPEEECTVGPVGMPLATLYVSISLVAFSVTTLPYRQDRMRSLAGPTFVPLSGALDFWIERNAPLRVIRKPEMELLASLRTKSRSPCTARLTGSIPREATLSTNCKPLLSIRKLVISLLPASTAKRNRPSSLCAMDPCTVPAIDGLPRLPVSNDWSNSKPPVPRNEGDNLVVRRAVAKGIESYGSNTIGAADVRNRSWTHTCAGEWVRRRRSTAGARGEQSDR